MSAESLSGSRPRIARLAEHIKNQIAAGEVVERPSSVVKELVENSLDAGATHIDVELEEGGVKLVRVRDDGTGIDPEDLELALAPHATSKLTLPEDLEHIASLGFRGEALASIASVSRLRITSRARGSSRACRIDAEGGQCSPVMETGSAEGTLIEVRDLFYNVPARRRFLKQTATELARCLDVLQRLALSHPGVAFTLQHDKKRVLDIEGGLDLAQRIRRAFGAELAGALLPVEAQAAGLTLSGYVAPPRLARVDTTRQMWFVNGRFVRDKLLLRALKEGYRGFLFDTRQPVAFLNLALDPSRVDVNVHPQKAEVRLRDERAVFGFVAAAVREAVRKGDLATPGAALVDSALRREARTQSAEPVLFPPAAPREPFRLELHERPVGSTQAVAADASPAQAPHTHAIRAPLTAALHAGAGLAAGGFVQVAKTYIVRALPDGFEIIDQHALHERITYECLRAELAQGQCECQRLLLPELVELSRDEAVLVAAHVEDLASLGFELQPFGGETIALHSYPARLERPRAAELVRAIAAALQEGRSLSRERLMEEVLHRAACRASVMAGDELEQEEMRVLLERGRALESDQTCVHGRPTRIRFTLADLERAFLRRV